MPPASTVWTTSLKMECLRATMHCVAAGMVGVCLDSGSTFVPKSGSESADRVHPSRRKFFYQYINFLICAEKLYLVNKGQFPVQGVLSAM
jgi:hypothetical protein